MIAVEAVTQVFETPKGELTAVRDVSFSVAAGRFVSLVGPSGCGKTTLLGMIAGLVPVSRGRITLGGRPVVGGVPPDLGYLFQRDALQLVTREGDRHREAALHNHLADLYHALGHEADSMEHLKQAVAIYAEIGGEAGAWQPEIWKLEEW